MIISPSLVMDYNVSNHWKFKERKDGGKKTRKPNTIRTNKIRYRLTYVPQKHKQKFKNNLRQKLATRAPSKPPKVTPPKTKIKVGSINLNGLDLEASWAVEQILTKHDLDVRYLLILGKIKSNYIS